MKSFLTEVLSGDRLVFSFVSAWVLAGGLWLGLDWLGNPNRGRFRPQREPRPANRAERKEAKRRSRAERDAAVRATLRDAYGASSIRFAWNREREAEVLAADDTLVRPNPIPHRAAPQPNVSLPVLTDTDLSPAAEPLLGTYDPEAEFVIEPVRPRGRWRRGLDPRMLSKAGKEPTPATLRTRVWKNCADDASWSDANHALMRAGKPARRWNPLTGQVEFCTVDNATARPAWRDPALEPFGRPR